MKNNIFVYFQGRFETLQGIFVEIQALFRVKLSKFRTLGYIPVRPGKRYTAPGMLSVRHSRNRPGHC